MRPAPGQYTETVLFFVQKVWRAGGTTNPNPASKNYSAPDPKVHFFTILHVLKYLDPAWKTPDLYQAISPKSRSATPVVSVLSTLNRRCGEEGRDKWYHELVLEASHRPFVLRLYFSVYRRCGGRDGTSGTMS